MSCQTLTKVYLGILFSFYQHNLSIAVCLVCFGSALICTWLILHFLCVEHMFPALYKYKHHSLFSYFVFMAYPVTQVHTNSDILFLLPYSNYFSLSFCIGLQQHVYVLTRSLLQSKCSLMFQCLSLLRNAVVHLLFKDIRFSLVFLLLCPPLLIQFSEKGPTLF